ncbi:MAG: hypothetical protein V7K89_31580 [Nostoc sp.]|uniref:hypothetical protein n=1 Tax=Nostoc sp. TaxID=1180 RepID=UPI002FFCB9DE
MYSFHNWGRRWNPRFAQRDGRGANRLRHRASFIELMTNLELPPQKMMEAVPANKYCGNLASFNS